MTNFVPAQSRNRFLIALILANTTFPVFAAILISGVPPQATVGTPYSFTFTAAGGVAPYTFAANPGVPAGLSLSPAGVISGTPTIAQQNSTVFIQATDSAANPSTTSIAVKFQVGASAPTAPVTILTSTLPAGNAGSDYSQKISASGGVLPYSWKVAPGSVPPPGLVFPNATVFSAPLSGVPSTPGTYKFDVQVSDSAGASATGTVSVTIANFMITTGSLPAGTVGTPYSQGIAASGGTPPYTFSGGPPLALGLTLSSSGTVSGTPTAATTISFDVQATDAASLVTKKTLSITIAAAPGPVIGNNSLADGVIGTPYTQTLSITGGTPPYTIAVTNGVLPAGLTLSSTGTISGTPTAASNNNQFTIQVTDSKGLKSAKFFVITVTSSPLAITTAALPPASAGVAYSQTLLASGGTPPLTFFSNNLPAGFQLSTTGVLSGTPTATGSLTFTVVVFDTSSPQAIVSKSFTLAVNAALTISTPSSLPAGTAGTPYSQTLAATGGVAPYTFSVGNGSTLPNGLTLGSTGALNGSPSQAGTFTFSAQAKDSAGATANKTFSITVNPAPLSITTGSALTDGGVDLTYTATFAGSGGTGQFTFGLAAGSSLPAGLQLSSSGVLTGAPKLAGSYSFSVSMSDTGTGGTVTKLMSLKVNPSPIVINTPATLPTATAGVPYIVVFSAGGGTGSGLSFTTADSAPPGLTFDSQSLSGTPTTGGSYTFSLTFADSGSLPVSRTFTLVVNPAGLAITTNSPLPGGTVGTPYSRTFNAVAGTPPYSFLVSSGLLPGDLTLAASGALTGTPTTAGQFTFNVQVTDSTGLKASQTFTLSISAAALTITTPALSAGQVGATYNQAVTASGGTPPYTFASLSGILPNGITLGSGGILTGTPTLPGNFGFTLAVTDSAGVVTARAYSIAVSAAGLMISTQPILPGATLGIAYSRNVNALGGTPPYTFAVSSGALPAGMSLSTGGILSGTPTLVGTFNFNITVTDSPLKSASMAFTLVVSPPALAIITTSPLPSGLVGVLYSRVFAAAGGASPYTFSLTTGLLPVGLTLGADGTLSGTPGAAGTFNFAVQVTDRAGSSASKGFSVTIGSGGLTITTAALPNATAGVPYSQALFGAGGTPPYSFIVIGGNLPPGLTLSLAGNLNGTVTSSGGYNFTVQMNDTLGAIAVKGLSITVGSGAGLTIATASPLPNAIVGTSYSQPLEATGGTMPLTWTAPGGGLPPGLALSSAGLLSGTPTGPGAYTFVLRATDAAGAVASQSTSITVAPSAAGTGPSISVVVNAASYALSAISPGEIVTIFGTGLGPATLVGARTTTPGVLDTSLVGTRVLFDGRPAPLIYVSDKQISTIVPYQVAGNASTRIQVEFMGAQSQALVAMVAETAPGVFAANASGRGPGAILNQDYTLNSAANPAPVGSVVILYATGEGQTDPSGVDGTIAGDVLPRPKVPVSVTMGGVPAQVLYAGAAPGIVAGGMQINVVIPDGLPTASAVPVLLTVGSKSSQNGVTVAVR